MEKFHNVEVEDQVESLVVGSWDHDVEKFKGGSVGESLDQPVQL